MGNKNRFYQRRLEGISGIPSAANQGGSVVVDTCEHGDN